MAYLRKHWVLLLILFVAALVFSLALLFIFHGGKTYELDSSWRNTLTFFSVFFFAFWSFSIYFRLQERRVKVLMIFIFTVILLWLALKTVKWTVQDPVLSRYLWYLYYLGFIGLPAFWLSLVFVLFIQKPLLRHALTVSVFSIAFVLFLLVMTNDLHFLVFAFPNGLDQMSKDENDYTYGIGYYVLSITAGVFSIASFVLFILGTHRRNTFHSFILPGLMMTALFFYLALYYLGLINKIPWQVPFIRDVTFMSSLFTYLFIEFSLESGLIQNNGRYRKFFETSALPLMITDKKGNPVYVNRNFEVTEDPGIKTNSREIPGGFLYQEKDLREIEVLQAEIAKTNEEIRNGNLTTEREGETLLEETRIQEMERVYQAIQESQPSALCELNQEIAALPEHVDDGNREETAEKLYLLKLTLSRLKERYMLLLSKSPTIPEAEFRLRLDNLLHDIERPDLKPAYALDLEKETQLSDALAVIDFISLTSRRMVKKANGVLVNVFGKEKEVRLTYPVKDPSLASMDLSFLSIPGYEIRLFAEEGNLLFVLKGPQP
jgi:PAS domain-containing protein